MHATAISGTVHSTANLKPPFCPSFHALLNEHHLVASAVTGLALLASTRYTREDDVGVGNKGETSTRGSLNLDPS